MVDRRKFLKTTSLAGASLLAGNSFAGAHTSASAPVLDNPIVISTWDFGIAANAAAWEVLKNNGRALDAVEKGVHVPEADPNNTTVGFGGAPDRDGKVTLDACIMDEFGNCGSVAALENIVHPISV
ncbi:isoaspartyl peptidase/L-asparaginase, partial [Daejeonella sp.]|uniref:isoaspartyl peptidase/L-asparaginase n=1 Tax=Daejeonella sp. TaxID=2805397 RepID=UPI0030BE91F4